MDIINAIWEHSYKDDCLPNFTANMQQPRHGWYEFKEGFSSTLVSRAISETMGTHKIKDFTVLDPFSGSGTSPLTALQNNCNAIGFEVNPFMSFVGQVKCKPMKKNKTEYEKQLNHIISQPPFRQKSPLEGISTFTEGENTEKWLFNLDVIRTYQALFEHIQKVEDSDLFLLALITSVMQCCNAKKDGKCLRYLKNWKELGFSGAILRNAFKSNALKMIADLEKDPLSTGGRIIKQGDNRALLKATSASEADLVIFSPPYLNSFDYSDIYRPELFLGNFIRNNQELMQLRKKTLRSHVQCKWDTIDSSDFALVKDVVERLETKKSSLWNSRIPQMVSSYFYDMETILNESYRISKNNAQLWIVVSTSAYSGIEIPVDLMLANIATSIGWELDSVNALRQLRTSSQCVDENKQRVKLRESLIICRK